MVERRIKPRRAADWRVLFGFAGDLKPGFVADITPMGICILSEEQPSTGTEIEVHFLLREDEPSGRLRMRAAVRHCGQGRIGAQFVDVDPSDREPWWRIIRGIVEPSNESTRD
jgi:hypothetical protein